MKAVYTAYTKVMSTMGWYNYRVCPEGADKEHGVPTESGLGATKGYPTGNH